MTTKNNSLSLYNDCNARELQMMVSKAVCAYANWTVARKCVIEDIDMNGDADAEKMRALTASKSEYEATVRCINMFVRESLVEVCQYVIAEAEEMMA